MDYNSERPDLKIPEYGRNVQRMVNHVKTLTDEQERNDAAHSVIQIMGQISPHLRDVEDFKHKLWDHLFIMSDYDLDVNSPYPKPNPETFQEKPDKLSYPSGKIKYGHYGKIIPELIAKTIEYPEGEEREVLINIIVNMMKKSYLTWNRDSVNDQLIIDQLAELSNGKLKVTENTVILSTQKIAAQNKRKKKFTASKSNGKTNTRNHKGKRRY